jgi:hypothetical protein
LCAAKSRVAKWLDVCVPTRLFGSFMVGYR